MALRRSLLRLPVGDGGAFQQGAMSESGLDSAAYKLRGVIQDPPIPTTRSIKARATNPFKMQSYIMIGTAMAFGLALRSWDKSADEAKQNATQESRDLLGEGDDLLPFLDARWWDNEWRKGSTVWNAVKDIQRKREDFALAKSFFGVDLANPLATFCTPSEKKTLANPSKKDQVPPRKALVPLAGTAKITKELLDMGYDVTAVDASEYAVQLLAQQLENERLTPEQMKRTHLEYEDIFTPSLWQEETGKIDKKTKRKETALRKYDLIYERQGLTSISLDKRSDYAYLLKRALKDDGVMYVEGIYRTGRVLGNKKRGPPYALLEDEIHELFPASEGYFVKCDNRTDAAIKKISREAKLLGEIPVNLYFTEFPCMVSKRKPVAQ